MPQMPKVELYAAIRRDHRAGIKMRELDQALSSPQSKSSTTPSTLSATPAAPAASSVLIEPTLSTRSSAAPPSK